MRGPLGRRELRQNEGRSVLRATIAYSLFCLSTAAAGAQVRVPAVTGTVTDSGGLPIAFAVVSVPGTRYAVKTDPRGRFVFDSLPQNPVTLRAEFVGYLPSQKRLVIQRSELPSVHFRLLPRAFADSGNIIHARTPVVMGQVTDTAGCPLAQAAVYVPGTTFTTTTNTRGEFAFDSLPANVVTLRASFIGYASSQIDTVRVKRGHTAVVALQLPPSRVKSSCTLGPIAPAPE
jgi:type IV secretory pathway protease TraF